MFIFIYDLLYLILNWKVMRNSLVWTKIVHSDVRGTSVPYKETLNEET